MGTLGYHQKTRKITKLVIPIPPLQKICTMTLSLYIIFVEKKMDYDDGTSKDGDPIKDHSIPTTHTVTMVDRKDTPHVVWLWSDTGADMESLAYDYQSHKERWAPTNIENVHHYNQEPIILLLDFTPQCCQFGTLLKALSKHRRDIENNIARVVWEPETIIITSLKSPEQCYHVRRQQNPGQVDQLLRLIDVVIECTPDTIGSISLSGDQV